MVAWLLTSLKFSPWLKDHSGRIVCAYLYTSRELAKLFINACCCECLIMHFNHYALNFFRCLPCSTCTTLPRWVLPCLPSATTLSFWTTIATLAQSIFPGVCWSHCLPMTLSSFTTLRYCMRHSLQLT